jgi:hypothetical protein
VTHRHRSLRSRLQHWLPSPASLRDHPRLGRWLAPFADPRLWTLSRRRVARGAAIGALFCVIPLPVQVPLAIVGAILLRANLPAAVAATLISNPLTMVVILTAAWKIGTLVIDEVAGAPPFDPHRFDVGNLVTVQGWLEAFNGVAEPVAVGLPFVGATLAVLVYAVVMVGWRLAVLHHRRKYHPGARDR